MTPAQRNATGTTDAVAPSAMVMGFRIHGFRSDDALIEAVRGRTGILMALNAEKLARADPRLQELSRRSIGYADGYGAVLALRRRGIRSARIAGADLWLRLVRRTAGTARVYLVGSTDEVIAEVARRLDAGIPGVEIAGYRDGYLSPDDEITLTEALAATRASIVLVAMGSPRQELLMDWLARRHAALYVGLGGSFDVYTGRRRRAPRLVQRIGLEWAHRFVVDPSRLPRLPAYVKFAWLLALNRL